MFRIVSILYAIHHGTGHPYEKKRKKTFNLHILLHHPYQNNIMIHLIWKYKPARLGMDLTGTN